ncbi:hypothetical protein ABK040_012872 [Willaertia magna]
MTTSWTSDNNNITTTYTSSTQQVDISVDNLFKDGFAKYFLNDLFADVSIYHVPTNKYYKCHRIILSYRSQFFDHLFNSPFRDSASDVVEVHFDDNDGVFEKVLEFIYSGKVSISTEAIVSLRVAADQLMCEELSKGVLDFLEKFLTNENVFSVLDKSLKVCDDLVLEKACGFLALHFMEIVETFQTICYDLPPQVFFGIIAHENLSKGSIGSDLERRNELISEIVEVYNKKYLVIEDIELLKLCVDALTQNDVLPPDTAIKYLLECDQHDLVEQSAACARVLASNYHNIKDIQLIFKMIPESFCELVSCDDLFIKNEDQVLDLVLQYLEKRGNDLTIEQKENIVKGIRLTFLSFDKLEMIVHSTIPFISEYVSRQDVLNALMERVKRMEKIPFDINDPIDNNLKPRTTRIFTHKTDFDENGILYYLGTAFYTEKYTSPEARGYVKISASCGFESGKTRDLISREPTSCNLINQNNSHITIEFVSILICPNAYTLRHTSARDSECLRNWRLQASTDGDNYIDLKVHSNDGSLKTKSESATWKIDGATEYYKYFRILQDGVNSSNNYYLSMAGFEIYGIVKSILDAEIKPIENYDLDQ